ncbi:MAG TPA: Uma2 family endonuclease [Leptospiraceae bacterium]|nr:Uma2 family endonuclease [Leptospiraceae bacterium]HMW06779.1 Uma2 family endonuclease [Leptospiraceae bacterium]HMY32275.1 Uma2 family endonuclease [Leptospiraceae bacterium]HMZ67404.1 Uma2 family endonuclease [Leptospiraceae bacterium]HNA10363.1 Uma2 family endonuclease [Leptospiraceae bacterium]
MKNLARQLLTESEYLALERNSETKHEYYKGEMFAMAGAKKKHNQIVFNIVGQLYIQLKDKPCIAFNSDMRVQVKANGLYTYPDISALCGEEKYLDEKEDTLLNPSLIVEVLSESTETYDRGKKFILYRELESLREYVLVSTEYKKVEIFRRTQNNQWLLTDSLESEPIVFETIQVSLSYEEIYNKVNFPSA